MTIEAVLIGAVFDLSWPAAPGVDGVFAAGAFDAVFAMGGFDGNEPSESMSQEKF